MIVPTGGVAAKHLVHEPPHCSRTAERPLAERVVAEHRPDHEADAVPRLVDSPGDHQAHVVHDLGRREVLVGLQDVEKAAGLGAVAEFVEPGQYRLFDGLGGAPADRERLGFQFEVRDADAEAFAPVPDLAEVVGVETPGRWRATPRLREPHSRR